MASKEAPPCREASPELLSIYEAYRPLAVATKILGFFPTTKIWRGPYGCREWCTPLICPFVQASYMLVVVVSTWKEITAPRHSHLNVIRGYLLLLAMATFMLFCWFQFLVLHWRFPKICRVFERLHKFDSRLRNQTNRSSRREAILLLVFFVAVPASFLLFSVCAEDKVRHDPLMLFSRTVTSYNLFLCVVTAVVIIFLSRAVQKRVAAITTAVEVAISVLPKTFSESPTCEETVAEAAASCLSELGGAFHHLGTTVGLTRQVFRACLLAQYVSFLAATACGAAYMQLSNGLKDYRRIRTTLYFEFLVSFCLLLVIAVLPNQIHENATAVVPKLYRIRLKDLNVNCRREVKQLIERLSGAPEKISINFFFINRGLVSSLIAAMFMYLVLLFEFKDYLVNILSKSNATIPLP